MDKELEQDAIAYELWREVPVYSIRNAACLWCKVLPSKYSSENTAIDAAQSMLIAAVEIGLLPLLKLETFSDAYGQYNDYPISSIERTELQKWAATYSYKVPDFLFDPNECHLESANPGDGHRAFICNHLPRQELALAVDNNQHLTPWLTILRGAIAQFFHPGRRIDPKREEVVAWINAEAVKAGMAESENIAGAIFTIIKPTDHNPKRSKG